MKKWFIPIGILLLLFIGGYFVLTFYAVKLIQPRLQKVMGPGFTLAEIKVKTTYLAARGIQYEDPQSKQRFLQIEEMRIYPSLLSFVKKSLYIKELSILRPSFFFYRSREGGIVGPWVTMKKEDGKESSGEGEGKSKRRESIDIQIGRIRIQEGSIDFEDGKVREPPAQIKLREVDFEIRDVRYPLTSSHSPIEFKAKMKGRTQEGGITLKGWIDAKTMDMETSLKVRQIEVETFEPYYRKRVTAEIESGYMDMDSKIAVREKRIDAPGELDLVNLHVKEGGGMVFWIPADTMVSLLEKKGHQIKVQFHLKGDMENPQFHLRETFLTQVGISFAQALGIPIKVVGEEVLHGTLKGEKGLVEELQSIEKLFKKKRERKR
jgi:hypothetical protein